MELIRRAKIPFFGVFFQKGAGVQSNPRDMINILFIRQFVYFDGHFLLEWAVLLLIGLNTTFIRIGSVIVIGLVTTFTRMLFLPGVPKMSSTKYKVLFKLA